LWTPHSSSAGRAQSPASGCAVCRSAHCLAPSLWGCPSVSSIWCGVAARRSPLDANGPRGRALLGVAVDAARRNPDATYPRIERAVRPGDPCCLGHALYSCTTGTCRRL
jgi:hypothetical protein